MDYIVAGELPAELGNLNLLEFNVHRNGLSGSIPFSMFNISTLEIVDMDGNYFSGYLPSMMGFSLPDLEVLYLSGNRLSGVIPSSITNASKLTKLDMQDNFLTGPIPNFGDLRLLQKFSIAENNLTGDSWRFFYSITNCRYLKFLKAFETKLSGVCKELSCPNVQPPMVIHTARTDLDFHDHEQMKVELLGEIDWVVFYKC
ncbi:putative LRR receptor-like serine/threonine-protein kinase [Forsythia ovata]|uniref:LRR receptor-like serine/threonine-protein kinase n=1 Tax=Forsythia ovata TaxID=205694 RepID=A0ABD1VN12_9LAMI